MKSAADTIKFTLEDDEGLETEHELPAKYEVCGRCGGRGCGVNPAIDGNGLTQEDFDADPDFEEAYFRGDYDQTCQECGGLRVVPVVDTEHLTSEQKAVYALWQKHLEDAARWDAEDAATQRMERGGW